MSQVDFSPYVYRKLTTQLCNVYAVCKPLNYTLHITSIRHIIYRLHGRNSIQFTNDRARENEARASESESERRNKWNKI